MVQNIVKVVAICGLVTAAIEAPQAYAIFGIRAARAVMVARQAKKAASPHEAAAENPQAQNRTGANTAAGAESYESID